MTLSSSLSLRRGFYVAVLAVLMIRVGLAAWVPITGDEAYFIQWGRFPHYGFYDHPPMVGWWLWGILQISDHPLILRAPQILLSPIIALLIPWLLRDRNDNLGYAVALAWLLLPPQVLNIAITTDTPLVLFSFLSVACFYIGLRDDDRAAHALSGIFLGLALLSKYFAGLLGLAYLVFVLVSPRREKRWLDLLIILVCALPFAALNLWWNYEHCWANVLFNLYNRHGDAGFALTKPLLFVGLLIFVGGPFVWWGFARATGLRKILCEAPHIRSLWLAGVVPLAVFALLSLVKNIGLHWLFAFVPPLIIAAGLILGAPAMIRTAKWMGVFSLVLLLGVVWIAAQPIETWRHLESYDGVIQTFRADEVLSALGEYEGKYFIATDSYSSAVTLSYNAQRLGFLAAPDQAGPRAGYIFVFGNGSHHARHDDILTDFRGFNGKNILVLTQRQPQPVAYRPYFSRLEVRKIEVRGADFYAVLGDNFDFDAYRRRVLEPVRRAFYRFPPYLTQGRCYFCERYFDRPLCPAG